MLHLSYKRSIIPKEDKLLPESKVLEKKHFLMLSPWRSKRTSIGGVVIQA